MISPLLPIAVGFFVSVLVTPLLRRLSHRHGLLDMPNARSSHVVPTPRSGGVAIIAGLVTALLLFGTWRDLRLLGVLVWAGTIAAMGLLDDVRSVSARAKLAVQFGTAIATIAVADVTLRFIELPVFGDLQFPLWVGVPITLLWIVGLTNAYNFMDGIDGIAAIQAIVCASTYSFLFSMQEDRAGLILSLSLVGSAAGFLVFNASGSIFMGDVGSSTLGFLFAVLALRLAYWDVPFFAAVLPLLPFLFDTGVTLVRRAARREHLFRAHRTHYYQKLTDLGWGHLRVSMAYGMGSMCCGFVSVEWKKFTRAELVLTVVGLIVVMAALSICIDRRVRPVTLGSGQKSFDRRRPV